MSSEYVLVSRFPLKKDKNISSFISSLKDNEDTKYYLCEEEGD